MAKTANKTAARAPRNLENVAAKAAQDAQEAARIAGQLAIDNAIADVMRPFHDAETKSALAKSDAEKAARYAAGERETLMSQLSQLAHKGQWNKTQCETGLDNAIFAVYAKRNSEPGTHRVLKSEMLQAMLPESREHIARVIADCATAWDRETRAIDDAAEAKKERPATPLRDKYTKRARLIMARVRAAQPEIDAAGKIKKPGHRFANANEIVADAIAAPKSARTIADGELQRLKGSIERFAEKYNVTAVANIKALIDALTVDALLGTVTSHPPVPASQVLQPAPVAAPAPAPAPEPVDAPAVLDDVLSDEQLIAIAMQAAMAAMRARGK